MKYGGAGERVQRLRLGLMAEKQCEIVIGPETYPVTECVPRMHETLVPAPQRKSVVS